MSFDTRSSLTLKVLFIGFLAVVLLIPLSMVSGLVEEREARRDEAVNEVSSTWGSPQDITGPMLVIPYRSTYTTTNDGVERTHTTTSRAYFLPETLGFCGRVDPQSRSRGIYEVILYSLHDLEVAGTFRRPDFARLSIPEGDVLWDRAFLVVGVSDTRALSSGTSLRWGPRALPFVPGVNGSELVGSGLHVALGDPRSALEPGIEFGYTLELRGSSLLRVAPLATQTAVDLESSWQHPSFFGAYLPTRHRMGPDGFSAHWDVSYFGSGLPQQFTAGSLPRPGSLDASMFGVRLYVPVDFYQKSERAVKYGFLFIGLTFLALLVFELFGGLTLHPLQYLLVGLAMSLFYLLFLSLAEHLGFLLAYWVASSAVIGLIGAYCAAVLGTRGRAAAIVALLAGLYGILFVLLENEAYALLLGSLALFGILAAVMFATRRIDWYAVRLGRAQADQA